MEEIKEFLRVLASLSDIAERKEKQYEGEMIKFEFSINEFKFNLFCVYNSVTVNIWWNNNFNIFVFMIGDQFEETNIKEAEKLFDIIRLPPNLVIGELNKIGVKEL